MDNAKRKRLERIKRAAHDQARTAKITSNLDDVARVLDMIEELASIMLDERYGE